MGPALVHISRQRYSPHCELTVCEASLCILERIKEHRESLIDREEASFRSGSGSTNHINKFWIIVMCGVKIFTPPPFRRF